MQRTQAVNTSVSACRKRSRQQARGAAWESSLSLRFCNSVACRLSELEACAAFGLCTQHVCARMAPCQGEDGSFPRCRNHPADARATAVTTSRRKLLHHLAGPAVNVPCEERELAQGVAIPVLPVCRGDHSLPGLLETHGGYGHGILECRWQSGELERSETLLCRRCSQGEL